MAPWTRLPLVMSVSVYAACCTIPLEGGVAQRLIDLATHPKSMQQDRQLPRTATAALFLCVLSPTLAQPQPVAS